VSVSDNAIAVFDRWFAALQTFKHTGGLPARGSIAAALVVLERLKTTYALDLDAHRAPGQAQIRGLSPSALSRVLQQFGESRPFLAEGGRTNRGGPAVVRSMLDAIRPLQLEDESQEDRLATLEALQAFLVEKVGEYHSRRRLDCAYDPAQTTWNTVHQLLQQAEAVGKAGPVAQYLVGAKLKLRFPDAAISNDRYSAGDVQTGRLGDFQLGDTAFHVTMSPGPPIYEKCSKNVSAGSRAYLLVPDIRLVGARQNADMVLPGRIAVESIESFVANNVEELSVFVRNALIRGFRALLEIYNKRVAEIEPDKSMLIEIPPTLEFMMLDHSLCLISLRPRNVVKSCGLFTARAQNLR